MPPEVGMQPVKINLMHAVPPCQRTLPPGETLRLVANQPVEKTSDSQSEESTLADAKPTNVSLANPTASASLPPPGLLPPPGIPSHGSCLHGTGRCRPCRWFWKPSGCDQGEDCLHCHLCPDSEIAERRKRRRARLGAARTNAGEADLKIVPLALSDCDTSVGSASEKESLLSCSSQTIQDSPEGSPRTDSLIPPPGLFFYCDGHLKRPSLAGACF